MAVKHIKGNIFNTRCQTIVNTVNCFGVMGKGIAFVHRLRYPKMYEEYKDYCNKKLIKIKNHLNLQFIFPYFLIILSNTDIKKLFI